MAKLKVPLLSLGAVGSIARILTFQRIQRQNIVHRMTTIKDVHSPAQLSWRHMYQKCAALWHTLSVAEKREWEALGSVRHMTGFAYWQSQCLKPNPGIYLPLQGGIMQGEINMNTYSIVGLPHPTGSGHATRKSYIDGLLNAHAALPNVHHTPPAPFTNEFFTTVPEGSANLGDFRSVHVVDGGSSKRVQFRVPHDYNSITDADLIIVPTENKANANLDIDSDYGAEGEVYNNHSEADTDSTYNLTINQLYYLDISGILSVLAAGDTVGISLTNSEVANDFVVHIIGLRFRYT